MATPAASTSATADAADRAGDDGGGGDGEDEEAGDEARTMKEVVVVRAGGFLSSKGGRGTGMSSALPPRPARAVQRCSCIDRDEVIATALIVSSDAFRCEQAAGALLPRRGIGMRMQMRVSLGQPSFTGTVIVVRR